MAVDSIKKYFNRKASRKLRVQEVNGHETHMVDPKSPRSLALLARAYAEVYEPGFPMPEEREPLRQWLDTLGDRHANVRMTISLLGEDLGGENPTLKAMTVGYYYRRQKVGLLAYIVTAPQHQGKGLGKSLNAANNQALLDLSRGAFTRRPRLRGIFLECNDPAKIKPGDDVMDPQARIDMYKRWGATVLPIDYVQPPLEKDGKKCDTLKLLAYPHPLTGAYPAPEVVKAYIDGIYNELKAFSDLPPKQNPDYLRAMEQLNAMPARKRPARPGSRRFPPKAA